MNRLEEELKKINRRPYSAYKGLKGSYRFPFYALTIDHVQGDPFAAPSRLHVTLTKEQHKIPAEYRDNENKRTALADVLLRAFGRAASKYAFKAKGSGKSGLISVVSCGQQVLSRSACKVGEDGSVLLRLEAGFPANGRTINSTELKKILWEYLPACVEQSLLFKNMNPDRVKEALDLYEDQEYLKKECKERGYIAFVADGSILPRESGVSQKPMRDAKPFYSPDTMKTEMILPHKGKMTGMAVKEGITLIVGGGYHGKSTLLKALETGIYHHIKGDGREYIVTDRTAFKIRAEDGRCITKTDISMFINHLPNGKDTVHFSTEDASGSTSQAANVAEAIESGVKTLLIDEDTSATNFMVRDELMEQVIAKEKEPITPFLSRAGMLFKEKGISTVLVAGSSGAYFGIADRILQMDCYEAFDITERVRKICPYAEKQEPWKEEKNRDRKLRVRPLDRRKGSVKVKQYGKDTFSVGKETIDLRGLEQIADGGQTLTLASLLKYTLEKMEKEKGRDNTEKYLEETWNTYKTRGLKAITGTEDISGGYAEVRRQDFYACFNRYRGFAG